MNLLCTLVTSTNPSSAPTNLHHRFRSLDSLDIDTCEDDIIPYKIDIRTMDGDLPCPFASQNDDTNQAVHVSYRPRASVTFVNVAVVW